ncbi:MAG: T9SS type A sorting domain-containing protein, partial [Bacteroidia bacterium]
TIDLDPGLPSYTVTSAGGYDLFISKLDPLGDLIWTKTSGGLSTDAVMNLVLDASSNVYSIGNFSGTVDFDPSSAVTTLTSNTSGSSDIFISKFDSNGNFKWAKNFGGTSINLPYSIAIDNDQNVYSTGFYIGVTDFDPANSNAIYGTYGNCDAFLLKLDSTGNYVWVKHFGGNGVSAFGKCLVTDASNNIYLTGYHNGTSDLDPSPTSSYSLTSAGGADLFITKLNSSGNFIWAHQIGGPEDDIGMDTKIDAAGSLYTTGYFSSTVDFDQTSSVFNIISSGENDAFIHKMNQLGLSVKENSYLNNVSLYPNPTSNYLNINLDEEVFKKLNPSSGLEVYNSLGVLVLKEPLDGPYTQVNIKKLSPGIFILKITDDNKLIYTHKIIKE